jgi:hypothetical protein
MRPRNLYRFFEVVESVTKIYTKAWLNHRGQEAEVVCQTRGCGGCWGQGLVVGRLLRALEMVVG